MGSEFAGLKRRGNPSGNPLATKVGQFAYWSAIVVIFAWAAWLRFRLPLDPIAVPSYVMPALRKLIGAEFGHLHLGGTIIYPGFVYLLVRAFGDFRGSRSFNISLGCWPAVCYCSLGSAFVISFRAHVCRIPFTPVWDCSLQRFICFPENRFGLK